MVGKLNYEEFWGGLSDLTNGQLRANIDHLLSENRSSTIFPVYQDGFTCTKISFLSYWLKKHGNSVVVRFIARDLEGNVLRESYEVVVDYKAYTFNVSEFFTDVHNTFCGSLEVEVFSKGKPMYTYPAITVSYDNGHSCSVVHSCIRTYNLNEINTDYAINFPQTGFDVEFSSDNKNYICFFGGYAKEYQLKIQLSERGVFRSYNVSCQNERYGKSHILYLEDIVPQEDIQFFNTPTCSIRHDFSDIFPRFYVGIYHLNYSPTITHTFFDTSKSHMAHREADIYPLRAKNTKPDDYFDSAFSIPVYPITEYDTVLKSYGQNLNFKGEASISLYSVEGDQLFSRSLSDHEVKSLSVVSNFDITQIIRDAGVPQDFSYSLHIAFIGEDLPFPNRFKLGFNVKKNDVRYGSNICFAPLVSSENTFSKPFCRRWFPIGGAQNFVASVHNTKLSRIQSDKVTDCLLEFVNHRGETLVRRLNLRDNSSVFLDTVNDKQIYEFLGDQGGWCMVTANTYLCDAYYFCMSDEQIGGDHAY